MIKLTLKFLFVLAVICLFGAADSLIEVML